MQPMETYSTLLKTKIGIPRSTRRYSLVKLPIEVLLLIGRQVQRTQDLQNLRLVCKLFDDTFAPIILSHIHLGSSNPLTGGASLRDLTRKYQSLAFVESLTIYSLERFIFQPKGFHEHCQAGLHYLLLASTRPFRYLRSAKDTPSLSKEVANVQEKYYLKKLQKGLPNLESVKWHIQINGPKTFRISFLKVLVLLPSLKELDLSLKLHKRNIKDLDSFIYPLAQVSDLQKLTLRLHHDGGPYTTDLQRFGRLIANNPNLVYFHLEWHEHGYGSLGTLRRLVPVDRLAQLKHLLFDTFFPINEPNMIPHLRSLQSLNIYWRPPPHFWETLALNGIFILFLTVGFVDQALCEYLLHNSSLVSFTIFDARGCYSRDPSCSPFGSHLFRALETTDVAHITIAPPNWAMWFHNAGIEASLRRCVKLRRITLNFFETPSPLLYLATRGATNTISRLGDEISLEIFGRYCHFCDAVEICGQSKDLLMQSLQRRLFHRNLRDLDMKSYFHDHIHSFEVLLRRDKLYGNKIKHGTQSTSNI